MEKAEFLDLLGNLARQARAAKAGGLYKMCTEMAADIARDVLGEYLPLSKKEAALFEFSQTYREDIKEALEKLPEKERPAAFNALRQMVNQAQRFGKINTVRADELRKITNEVEDELNAN